MADDDASPGEPEGRDTREYDEYSGRIEADIESTRAALSALRPQVARLEAREATLTRMLAAISGMDDAPAAASPAAASPAADRAPRKAKSCAMGDAVIAAVLESLRVGGRPMSTSELLTSLDARGDGHLLTAKQRGMSLHATLTKRPEVERSEHRWRRRDRSVDRPPPAAPAPAAPASPALDGRTPLVLAILRVMQRTRCAMSTHAIAAAVRAEGARDGIPTDELPQCIYTAMQRDRDAFASTVPGVWVLAGPTIAAARGRDAWRGQPAEKEEKA